jgi:hypothetical protein
MQTEYNKVCARSKLIDLQYWFIVDHIMKKDIVAKFIASEDMKADCLTKPYSGPATQMSFSKIGMCAGLKDDYSFLPQWLEEVCEEYGVGCARCKVQSLVESN